MPTQVLSEALPLAGTPFNLTYSSARAAGRKGPRTLTIPLTTTNPPAGLQRVDLSIDVALAQVRSSVRDRMRIMGLMDVVGEDHVYLSMGAAVDDYRRRSTETALPDA